MQTKTESLAARLRRRWWRSGLCWAHYRWVVVHSDPTRPGFWRGLERGLRASRKGRSRPRSGALATTAPQFPLAAPLNQAATARPTNDPVSVALYVNSRGNYFFRELAELLQAGLAAAGLSCALRTERDGACPEARRHLVFAPHEFFFLADGWRCFDRAHQGKLLLLNTEQTHTQWFRLAARSFFLARHIFDMSEDSVRVLQARGHSASHLRFGFVEGFGRYDGTRPLPLVPETEALPASVRDWRDTDLPLAARPLDVCFFGEATTRRAQILAELAPMLQGVESYLRLKPQGGEPWLAESSAPDHHTRLSTGIARRSKVLLNLHRNEEPYFEWHRVVLMGLWHRTLVVTEPVTDSAPFVAGRDFVQTDLGKLAGTLEYHLRDPRGVAEAERIREQGHRTLREACDFAQHLRAAWRPIL
jgi:hypothetical protein